MIRTLSRHGITNRRNSKHAMFAGIASCIIIFDRNKRSIFVVQDQKII